jgi:PTH2 family peptidyl-tRNA hydrolase
VGQENYKQVIVVRTDLGMGKGKLAAQVAHASLAAYKKALKKHVDWVHQWEMQGAEKVVLKIGSEHELVELYKRVCRILPCAMVRDAGRTQLPPNTKTCVAIGPAPEQRIDRFTGHLKLL